MIIKYRTDTLVTHCCLFIPFFCSLTNLAELSKAIIFGSNLCELDEDEICQNDKEKES